MWSGKRNQSSELFLNSSSFHKKVKVCLSIRPWKHRNTEHVHVFCDESWLPPKERTKTKCRSKSGIKVCLLHWWSKTTRRSAVMRWGIKLHFWGGTQRLAALQTKHLQYWALLCLILKGGGGALIFRQSQLKADSLHMLTAERMKPACHDSEQVRIERPEMPRDTWISLMFAFSRWILCSFMTVSRSAKVKKKKSQYLMSWVLLSPPLSNPASLQLGRKGG